MASLRQERVGRMLQKDLGEVFQKDLKDHFSGIIVSVTIVRLAQDLSSARVYLSVFPSKHAKEVVKNIQESTKIIRNLLAQRVKNQMRKVPELYFYHDDSVDYAKKIDDLLK
jgi:ribosome-binding factor A